MDNKSKRELYKLGSKLCLDKKDIDGIIMKTLKNDALNSPVIMTKNALDVYSLPGRYGTISKKDFQ